uniref:Uncharacterized protein n=1 Tax=Oryza brachyantha TaxID=4533 RepID=J3N3P0_ORYBR
MSAQEKRLKGTGKKGEQKEKKKKKEHRFARQKMQKPKEKEKLKFFCPFLVDMITSSRFSCLKIFYAVQSRV